MRLVETFLDEVALSPSALVFEGEPGIGKSTLWNTASAIAAERSFLVLSTRPAESEAKLSYTAITDLLADHLEALAELPEPQRAALEVALLQRKATRRGPDHRTISVAFLGTIRSLSRAGPMIIAVDDAQWLDAPSARVIEFALRRLDDETIGVVATARTGPDQRFLPQPAPAIDGSRLHRVVVGPLSVDAISRLVRDRLEVNLPLDVIKALHRTSGGNPLMALEVADVLIRNQKMVPLFGEPMLLPQHLVDLMRFRVADADAGVREVLLVASALSNPTVPLVVAATVNSSRSRLSRAAASGLVEVDGDRIRFSHPLLSSAVYADASRQMRRRVHRRLSEVVTDPEERARHLGLATEAPDPEVASTLEDAARLAFARGAPDTAAMLFERSWKLTPPIDMVSCQRRVLEAAKSHDNAGESATARALLEQLVSTPLPGPSRAEALLLLAQVRSIDDWTESSEILEQALREVGQDSWLEARIRVRLAWNALYGAFDLPIVRDQARAALNLCDGRGDADLLGRALSLSGMAAFLLGEEDALSLLNRAQGLEGAVDGFGDVRLPTYLLANLPRWMDDIAGARPSLESLREQTLRRGDEPVLYDLLHDLVELECWAGNWERALQHAEKMHDAALLMDWPGGWALAGRALIEAHFGRADVARADAQRSLELARSEGETRMELKALCVLGFLDLSLAQPARAVEHLSVVASQTAPLQEPGFLRYSGDYVEALITFGELERAKDELARLEEQGRARDRPWAIAISGRCRGLLDAALGDLPGGLAAIGSALEVHADLPMPFELARTILVQGEVQRRAGERKKARDSLQRAMEMFDGLGAALWSARAGSELSRLGGRAPSKWALTPSEERVARLVAQGRTNKEVAAALFISVNTVQSTLRSVFRKLDVRSRAELAHRMSAGGTSPNSSSN